MEAPRLSTHPTPRRSTGTRVKVGYDDPTLTGHDGLLFFTVELLEACRRQPNECSPTTSISSGAD